MWNYQSRATTVAVVLAFADFAPAADRLEYNRDIRPILAENCFACHGPDSAARKAKLRLDLREEAIRSEAVVPGKPEASAAILRILSDDAKKIMPPAKSRKTLTAAQKDVLRRWVAAGAEYQAHWSFIAPVRPPLPAVKDAGWVRNPIDRFILAELEKRGLKPAREADRRTLARRLSLDLIGLPPTPAEVEAFVTDSSADAYDKFVDQLMRSPHWGEHRGRFWLDAARYGDTHGIHIDNFREMWTYRDWVINAFNRNLPFDQFSVEQLAGDLLPNRTLDQVVASGFNRCNITTSEGGAIAEEYAVLYTRDRTETTAAVWMGLTANCAVCHDHKFDPLSQKEFYSMAAFFNNTTQQAMDGNIKDTPPIVPVPPAEERKRWDALSNELSGIRKQAEARKQVAEPDFSKWLAAAEPLDVAARIPSDDLQFHAPLSEGEGSQIHVRHDGRVTTMTLPAGNVWAAGHVAAKTYQSKPGSVVAIPDAGDFEKDQAFSVGAWVKLPVVNVLVNGAVVARMEDAKDARGWDLWIQNGRVGANMIHKGADDALKVLTRDMLQAKKWHHVFVTYDGSGKAAGVKVYIDGIPQEVAVESDKLKNSIRTGVPLKIAQRDTKSRLNDITVQDVRIYGRVLPAGEVQRLAKGTRAAYLAAKPKDRRLPAEVNELFDWWLLAFDGPYQAIAKALLPLQQEEASIKSRGTIAHVMQERPQEAMAYVLFRGDYDKRRDAVKPDTPRVLPALPRDERAVRRDEISRGMDWLAFRPMVSSLSSFVAHPSSSTPTRVDFARWLVRPEHPLTARVTVNRFWQEVFGAGIVRTSGDFGVSGELPSHPELLDWLAVEFRESGWDVKKLFRLLVTSAAYRQSAALAPEKLDKDPQNRLLSRGPRFRMDGEQIRDYALAASGLLVRRIGGPSVKPYQPEGVWEAVAMIGSNTRIYQRDSGDNLYRRSLYTFWKRSAPPASLDIFNAPSRENSCVRRERTNTPLQALVTMNDVQFVEAARVLAEKCVKEAGDKQEARLGYLAGRLLCRPFRPEEARVVQASFDELLGYYKQHADDAKKLLAVGDWKHDPSLDAATLAAWTMVVNEVMNLDEVLNK